jgi:DNA-binding NarL/FixJ family response regulator
MTIRVVIVDDQGMVRTGLRSLLTEQSDIEVVGDAPDGEEAVSLILRQRPDVALMDIRMPRLDGLAATRRLVAQGTSTRILVLTTFDLDEYVFEALQSGASGFLLKDASAEELADAVRVLARGEALLAPAVTRRVIEAFGRIPKPGAEAAEALAQLSGREIEVLRLLARGCSNAEISDVLVVSTATIKSHVSSVLTKLGLRDRVQAAILAYESGLVHPGDSGGDGEAPGSNDRRASR